MMRRIKLLGGQWMYDSGTPLGREGGFGVVFAGTAENYGSLAIKRLKLDAETAAHRELRIAEELTGRSFEYVIPILDSGLDAESNSYFVVMARAEKSLQDEIDSGHRSTDSEAARVIFQIASGLKEVSDIVHRDLKPANVLYHEGKWKVADFGIAKFVEESTSMRTLSGCLTPPYAAPEQWREKRASHATDVYALGCIAQALVTESPPFRGPTIEDYRRQHLTEAPPELLDHDPIMRSMVSMMLRKPPESRPSIDRVLELCQRIATTQQGHNAGVNLNPLAQAGAKAAQRKVAEEAAEAADAAEQERRMAIAQVAEPILIYVLRQLANEISAMAPTVRVLWERPEPPFPFWFWFFSFWRWFSLEWERPFLLSIELEDVALEAHYYGEEEAPFFSGRGSRILGRKNFPRSRWDVVLGARLAITKGNSEKTATSLWYTNLGTGGDYRWYEVGYGRRSWLGRVRLLGLEPRKADRAAAGKGRYKVAFGPVPIDDEDSRAFCNRWLSQFSEACVK